MSWARRSPRPRTTRGSSMAGDDCGGGAAVAVLAATDGCDVRLSPQLVQAVADYLDLSVQDLQSQLQAGQSIAELARAARLSQQQRPLSHRVGSAANGATGVGRPDAPGVTTRDGGSADRPALSRTRRVRPRVRVVAALACVATVGWLVFALGSGPLQAFSPLVG